MRTKVSLWQKYWPRSTYNTHSATIQTHIDNNAWSDLTYDYRAARALGGLAYAAFTPDIIELATQRILATGFKKTRLGANFLDICLGNEDHGHICRDVIVADCMDNIKVGLYSSISTILEQFSHMQHTVRNGNNAAHIAMKVTEALLGDTIDYDFNEQSDEGLTRAHLWTKLYEAFPDTVRNVFINKLDYFQDGFDIDAAIDTLEVAREVNILRHIPAHEIQLLLDNCLQDGMPAAAMCIYNIVAKSGCKHLRYVGPDLDEYSFLSYPTTGTPHQGDYLTFMFRHRAENPEDAIVCENDTTANISVPDMLDMMQDGNFVFYGDLDTHTSDVMGDLCGMFYHMAHATQGETAAVAQKIMPALQEWHEKSEWVWPPTAHEELEPT